ncbi:hypothetical protein CK203_044626 [Vitis vinifera]|uniref:Uncharacterized protein n=1 Tax=Vitis vinifera TaxID=29760 RepID=A0A438HJG8_VITVI|nr:hypothetical protein CK203_044626 [Vitis vinifera]
MARTRGAKSSSPSSRKRVPREAPVQGPTSEPPRPKAASPPAKPAPQILRRGVISLGQGAVPCKREPGSKLRAHRLNRAVPGSLTRALSGTIFGAVVRASAELQEHQPPLSESQIPSGIAPEVLIRRPMLTQPPIEGNLDCELDHFTLSCALTQPPSNCGRSLQIHSTYCADIAWSIC